MKLYEINDEELFIWSLDAETAMKIATKAFDIELNSIKQIHSDEIVCIVSDDEKTGDIEWRIDIGDKLKCLRRTTVRKLALELESRGHLL